MAIIVYSSCQRANVGGQARAAARASLSHLLDLPYKSGLFGGRGAETTSESEGQPFPKSAFESTLGFCQNCY